MAFANWFGELLRATCQEKPTVIAHSLLGTAEHIPALTAETEER